MTTTVSPLSPERYAGRHRPERTRPFAAFEWLVALRYLGARRKEGFISVIALFSFLGIMLGVLALIVVLAVMNGFKEELQTKILEMNGHIVVSGETAGIDNYNELVRRLAAVPDVTTAIPFVEGQALASSPQGARAVLVRGLMAADIRRLPSLTRSLTAGSLDNFDDGEGVLIGTLLAEKLGLKTGDDITLLSPRGNTTILGTMPRTKAYRVAGTFAMGMSDIDNSFVLMPFAESQAYFNRSEQATAIELFVRDAFDIGAVRQKVEMAADRPVYLLDWTQRNVSFFQLLTTQRNVLFFILLIIVIVAAFNVVSGLIMLVKDKGGEIAILRSMGATRGAVMRIFLITGMAIGVAGTAAGLAGGLLVIANIDAIRRFVEWVFNTQVFPVDLYYLTQLPAIADPVETGVVVATSLALCFVATLYPSFRAARLDPVQALRYE